MNSAALIRPAGPKRVGRVLTYRWTSIVALLFPPTGIPALIYSLRAGKLARQEKIEEARTSGQRARDLGWISLGVGMSVYTIAFGSSTCKDFQSGL